VVKDSVLNLVQSIGADAMASLAGFFLDVSTLHGLNFAFSRHFRVVRSNWSENYPGRSACFCDRCFGEYPGAPTLPAAERYGWLKKEDLLDSYADYLRDKIGTILVGVFGALTDARAPRILMMYPGMASWHEYNYWFVKGTCKALSKVAGGIAAQYPIGQRNIGTPKSYARCFADADIGIELPVVWGANRSGWSGDNWGSGEGWPGENLPRVMVNKLFGLYGHGYWYELREQLSPMLLASFEALNAGFNRCAKFCGKREEVANGEQDVATLRTPPSLVGTLACDELALQNKIQNPDSFDTPTSAMGYYLRRAIVPIPEAHDDDVYYFACSVQREREDTYPYFRISLNVETDAGIVEADARALFTAPPVGEERRIATVVSVPAAIDGNPVRSIFVRLYRRGPQEGPIGFAVSDATMVPDSAAIRWEPFDEEADLGGRRIVVTVPAHGLGHSHAHDYGCHAVLKFGKPPFTGVVLIAGNDHADALPAIAAFPGIGFPGAILFDPFRSLLFLSPSGDWWWTAEQLQRGLKMLIPGRTAEWIVAQTLDMFPEAETKLPDAFASYLQCRHLPDDFKLDGIPVFLGFGEDEPMPGHLE